jgi:hypothetical protein
VSRPRARWRFLRRPRLRRHPPSVLWRHTVAHGVASAKLLENDRPPHAVVRARSCAVRRRASGSSARPKRCCSSAPTATSPSTGDGRGGLSRTVFYRHLDDMPRRAADASEDDRGRAGGADAGARDRPLVPRELIASGVETFSRCGPFMRALDHAAGEDAEIEAAYGASSTASSSRPQRRLEPLSAEPDQRSRPDGDTRKGPRFRPRTRPRNAAHDLRCGSARTGVRRAGSAVAPNNLSCDPLDGSAVRRLTQGGGATRGSGQTLSKRFRLAGTERRGRSRCERGLDLVTADGSGG